jgi:tRNA(His) 5'-end guanylyltransferase
MTTKDSLGDRMKHYYEDRYRIYLTRRIPVIIRIDGKAFHSFTKGLNRPYDMVMKNSMWATAKELCENIMGCQLAYVQSDEISLLLTDYRKLTTEAWFDYNLQKICSVSASMATRVFNKWFRFFANETVLQDVPDGEKYCKLCRGKIDKAEFDARAFNIPENEVCNYFIWRQQDATRNSIEMLGLCYFNHKELHGVSCNKIQDKLMLEKNVNWNDCPTFFKRGVCIRKVVTDEGDSCWEKDMEIPIFTQDRGYIEELLKVEEE